MLEKIRNDVAHNKFVRAMLIFTTLAFVAWGVGFSSLSLFSKNYAMKVGSVEITPTEYYRAYQNAKASIAKQLGGQKLPPEFLKSLGIDLSEKAVQTRINDNFQIQALLENFAKDNKIFISPRTVLSILKQEPAFQKDGKFDPQTYKAALRNANMTPIFFEKDIAKKMSYALISKMFKDTVRISQIELDTQIQYEQERRDASILTLTKDDVINEIPEATENELNKIYQNNKDLFLVPEKRDIKLLSISRNSVSDKINVSEQEVQNYYAENKQSYLTKREFKVKQILVNDKADADKVLANKDLNKNFTKYVQEFSIDEVSKKKNGDMGWLTSDLFSEEITNALNTTPKGEISVNAIQSPFGFHIFKVVDIREPKQKDLKLVKDKVIASIKSEKIDNLVREKTDTAMDLVAAGESLDTISKQIGVSTKSIEMLTQANKAKYVSTAFQTELGEVSEPIDIDLDTTAFVEVTNIEEEFVKPLNEIKNRVIVIYNKDKAQKLLIEKAEKVLKDIKENNIKLTKAAKKYKITSPIKTAVSVSRTNGASKGLEENTTKAIFNTKVANVNSNILYSGEKLEIVKVISSYQEKAPKNTVNQIKTALRKQKESNFYELFINKLEQEYPTTINQPMIDTIASQVNSRQ